MISPKTARQRIARHCRPLGSRWLPLAETLGHVLAEDVRSSIAMPAFDNSAMDGYAVRSADTSAAGARNPVMLKLTGTVYAGDGDRHVVARGHAMGIMTGAPVPAGADAVVPVERATLQRGLVVVIEPAVRGRHIRRRAEEIHQGARVLKHGTLMHPGAVACAASVGRDRLRVIRRPTVSVLATGDETVQPGQGLRYGEIYDSNSFMLRAMLERTGYKTRRCRRVKDRLSALTDALADALAGSDVVIVSGGVSVGEKDYLRAALRRLRVRQVFWRVRQKPGKPLYFGVKGGRMVFGLPGNPASAFTCFCAYVYPALCGLSGLRPDGLDGNVLRLAEGVSPDAVKWLLLKGKTSRQHVTPLAGQGSHMITSLVETDRLIVVPPGRRRFRRGTKVHTIPIPFAQEESP